MGEECHKSAAKAPRPLRRLLIRFDLPPGILETLRANFPHIDIVQAPDAFTNPTPVGDADALVTWALSPDEIDAAPNLRWVQWIGAGVDHAPLEALQKRGILLTNNRGVHANNIAEHVIGMMIAMARNFPRLVHAQDERHWSIDDNSWTVRELAGSHLLILGAGNLGSAVATKALGMGIDVTVVGRNARADFMPGVEFRNIGVLDELLPSADHVVICVPLTSETSGLFDARRIGLMKRGSILYNVGRGPIVETEALIAALECGHLGGAGLDVSDPEPLPPQHPLWQAPGVFITGHTSGRTPYYWQRGSRILEGNIRHYLAGEPLDNLVDYELGY